MIKLKNIKVVQCGSQFGNPVSLGPKDCWGGGIPSADPVSDEGAGRRCRLICYDITC